jgi:hypothetical protein
MRAERLDRKCRVSGPEIGPEKGPAQNACKKFLTSRANLLNLCPPQRPLGRHLDFLFRTLNKEKLQRLLDIGAEINRLRWHTNGDQVLFWTTAPAGPKI